MKIASALLFVIGLFLPAIAHAEDPIHVGSKRFTESYVLGEIVSDLIRANGGAATHEQGLGATAVAFRALQDGRIDALPEYTGTLAETVTHTHGASLDDLRKGLAPLGLSISDPIGFENTYALATTKALADARHLQTTSDLAAHPDLRVVLSHEFAGRSDGWIGLAQTYSLHPTTLSAMDHGLAYEAIAKGGADVVDVYTTDASIARYGLTVLADDRHFFPRYDAVLVYRTDVAAKSPAFSRSIAKLAGMIDVAAMQTMNGRVEQDGVPVPTVASDFLAEKGFAKTATEAHTSFLRGLVDAIVHYGPRHLELVLVSLFFSALLGIPLGILAYVQRRAGVFVLGVVGIVQTIPSLALFCFFVPLLGIGVVPALAALLLYGLLPIVRNAHAGLASIPADLREAALALGLTTRERLVHVELPLAARTILAGVKTSAVVAVGSATIAAFIGAGGFGEPISTGLSLNDVPTILQGAIPAALLALVVQIVFELVETRVLPKELR